MKLILLAMAFILSSNLALAFDADEISELKSKTLTSLLERVKTLKETSPDLNKYDYVEIESLPVEIIVEAGDDVRDLNAIGKTFLQFMSRWQLRENTAKVSVKKPAFSDVAHSLYVDRPYDKNYNKKISVFLKKLEKALQANDSLVFISVKGKNNGSYAKQGWIIYDKKDQQAVISWISH